LVVNNTHGKTETAIILKKHRGDLRKGREPNDLLAGNRRIKGGESSFYIYSGKKGGENQSVWREGAAERGRRSKSSREETIYKETCGLIKESG